MAKPESMSDFNLKADDRAAVRSAVGSAGAVARSEQVNRTHRVVRERAKSLAARRSSSRSLWLPLILFSALLVAICYAAWSMFGEYEVGSTGSGIANYPILVPVLWSIPVSAALLAVIWFRQSRKDTGDRRDR